MKNNILQWIYLFLLSSFISKVGNKIYMLAIPILVYDMTNSSLLMGSMFFIQTIPILLSAYFGAFADTFNKKKLMLISNIVQFIIVTLICLLTYVGMLNIFLLFLFGFLISLAGALFGVSNESVIPEIVKDENLLRVNSIFQFLDTSSLLIGPALGGILLSVLSIELVFLFDALSFVPLIISIMFMKYPSKSESSMKRESMHEKVKKGFSFVINHKILAPIMILSFAVNFSHGAIESMFVFFVKDELALSNAYVGIIFSIAAAAQLLFAIFTKYWTKKSSHQGILLNSQIVSGIGVLIMSTFNPWYLIAMGRALQEGPVVSYNIVNRTLRQRIVSKEFLGRVNGINRMIALSSFPIAGFFSGFLAEFISIKLIIGGAGIILIIIGAIGYLTPISLANQYLDEQRNLTKEA